MKHIYYCSRFYQWGEELEDLNVNTMIPCTTPSELLLLTQLQLKHAEDIRKRIQVQREDIQKDNEVTSCFQK